MDKEQLGKQAESLNDNEVFQLVLATLRTDALEVLAKVNATDADLIRDQQAIVRVVDEMRDAIDAFIRNGKPRRATGIV